MKGPQPFKLGANVLVKSTGTPGWVDAVRQFGNFQVYAIRVDDSENPIILTGRHELQRAKCGKCENCGLDH